VTLDRSEAQGIAFALALHVALVIALTMNIAHPPREPEPAPVEIELVDSDEIALTAAAPSKASPPPQAMSPSLPEPVPSPPEPSPAPTPPQPIAQPVPAPIVRPTPAPRPSPPQARPAPARPSPAQTRPTPARPSPQRPAAPRQSRLGDDFLAGVPEAPARQAAQPAQQGAPTFSAAAKASVNEAILRQIRPCADRQPALGPGADRLRVVLNLRLDRSGRLSRPPVLVDVRGVDDENRAFEDLAYNQAVAVFRACSPLRLPAELYSTPQGGWGNITMTYRAK
jgi:outer membrane biosynthesis protein TonB